MPHAMNCEHAVLVVEEMPVDVEGTTNGLYDLHASAGNTTPRCSLGSALAARLLGD